MNVEKVIIVDGEDVILNIGTDMNYVDNLMVHREHTVKFGLAI